MYTWLVLLFSFSAWGSFSNYKSVLLGDRASGMGGAFTAMYDDPSSVLYYNPAAVARVRGSSFSAAATVYHKYDTDYGETEDFFEAGREVNRGFFRSLPSASGSILAYGSFAFGLSILVPDYDSFNGQVASSDENSVFLNYTDESLWVGGGVGINVSRRSSIGISIYYTSRNLQRSAIDETRIGGNVFQTTEEKTSSNNSLVYNMGFFTRMTRFWNLGLNFRPPSVQINGTGSYFRSFIDTQSPANSTQENFTTAKTDHRIPMKAAIGIAYNEPKEESWTFDITYHGREKYDEFRDNLSNFKVRRKEVVNLSTGYEVYVRDNISMRMGLFTNFTANREHNIDVGLQADAIDMWGFSANLGVFTSDQVSFSFGGYFMTGKGKSIQEIGQRFQIIDKSQNLFSMLLSTAYYF